MICIADSLRVLQHVETVSIPNSWDSLDLKTWHDVSWNKKQFEVCKLLKILHKFVYFSCCSNTGVFFSLFIITYFISDNDQGIPGMITRTIQVTYCLLLFLYSHLKCVQTSTSVMYNKTD